MSTAITDGHKQLKRVCFITPPKHKQIGGIENAIHGLRATLTHSGIEIVDEDTPRSGLAVHHFHGLWTWRHSRLASQLHRKGRLYVVSPHGMLEPWAFHHRTWKKRPYFFLFEKRFLARATALFVTSRLEARNLHQLVEHPRIEILPLGSRDRRGPDYLAARDGLGWTPNERVLLFLSRLHPKKGLDLLLHALTESATLWTGWRLVVIGDGQANYLAELKALAEKLSKRLPPIKWVGPLWGDRRWRYLQGADLFCLPSHSENFGLAVLEALHVGTPVLTTDQTPWADYRERPGLFIAKPEVQSIRHGLGAARARVESNWTNDNRRSLANWGQELFAWEKLAPAYIEAYERAFR